MAKDKETFGENAKLENESDNSAISIIEFFKRHKSKFDKYVISYLSVEHKGDMKKEDDWLKVLEQYMLKK